MTKLVVAGGSVAIYGSLIEPLFRLRVTHYAFAPPSWPRELRLRLAIVADLHACEPWMTAERVKDIVDLTNSHEPDCALLVGDYVATHHFQRQEPASAWSRALARLDAPLGVHAVLGNHDWWADEASMRRGEGLPDVGKAMQDAGLAVYQNDAVRLVKDGKPFWIVGLGDQIAFVPVRGWRHPRIGIDDLSGTLTKVDDDAPIILLAHEPDIFPSVPARVSLTLSGHTHGGQLNFFGWRPVVPSQYGARYAYGHVIENDRHLVVSSGLCCSIAPVRIGSPPEIVVIDLGAG